MAAAVVFVDEVLVLISRLWAGHKHLLPPQILLGVCVPGWWPGLTVWPTSFNLHWALVLWFAAELGGVEGWKHRVAL